MRDRPDMTPTTPSPRPFRSPVTMLDSSGILERVYISWSQKQASRSKTTSSGNGPLVIFRCERFLLLTKREMEEERWIRLVGWNAEATAKRTIDLVQRKDGSMLGGVAIICSLLLSMLMVAVAGDMCR